MSYSSGFLKDCITIQRRTAATQGIRGIDSGGIEWEDVAHLHANVGWQKGKAGMHAGALDSYAVVIVRMRWNRLVDEHSRIVHRDTTYQILPETFHADRQANEIQFMAQAIVE